MSSFPLETLTLLGSSLLGTLSKLVALFMSAKKEERLMQLRLMAQRGRFVDDARRYTNPAFQWTRRAISLLAVFFIVCFPKIVAVFFPDIPVVIGYSELQKSLFSSGSAHTVWQNTHGLIITPLDTHLLAAIIGLYFGGSLAQN